MREPNVRKAMAAGRKWAEDLARDAPRLDGPLPAAFDALAHLSSIGDTDDPDQRAEEIREATFAAHQRWAELVKATLPRCVWLSPCGGILCGIWWCAIVEEQGCTPAETAYLLDRGVWEPAGIGQSGIFRAWALDQKARADAAETRLRAVLAVETPWPLHDVLARLVGAVDHLAKEHDCDRHGHELDARAAVEARRILAVIKAGGPA